MDNMRDVFTCTALWATGFPGRVVATAKRKARDILDCAVNSGPVQCLNQTLNDIDAVGIFNMLLDGAHLSNLKIQEGNAQQAAQHKKKRRKLVKATDGEPDEISDTGTYAETDADSDRGDDDDDYIIDLGLDVDDAIQERKGPNTDTSSNTSDFSDDDYWVELVRRGDDQNSGNYIDGLDDGFLPTQVHGRTNTEKYHGAPNLPAPRYNAYTKTNATFEKAATSNSNDRGLAAGISLEAYMIVPEVVG